MTITGWHKMKDEREEMRSVEFSGGFPGQVHAWYVRNKRDLPWRETTDPYRIWISEVILQQTRVVQGLEYYLRFTERFPTVRDLANAPADEVMKLWQGLGYYSRARNMHMAAQHVAEKLDGRFPGTYAALLMLPGVGKYTAAAVASIAYNERVAAVDGNVSRVLARYFGITDPVDSAAGIKKYFTLANEFVSPEDPGMHNQALMEFGALLCRPRTPLCHECPLQLSCYAAGNKMTGTLPVKKEAKKQKNRFFTFWCIEFDDLVFLEKRTAKDIWKGLYQFPANESQETDFRKLPDAKGLFLSEKCEMTIKQIFPSRKHILTHQIIHARLVLAGTNKPACLKNRYIPVKKKDLVTFAVPKLMEDFFRELKIIEN